MKLLADIDMLGSLFDKPKGANVTSSNITTDTGLAHFEANLEIY